MSPEQVRGSELDERSDLYSAGVVMFEMFTGRRPFDAGDPFELMRLHLEEPAPNPRTLQPTLPELLADTIVACLAKARADRPATASTGSSATRSTWPRASSRRRRPGR